jgi:hypothetical protein
MEDEQRSRAFFASCEASVLKQPSLQRSRAFFASCEGSVLKQPTFFIGRKKNSVLGDKYEISEISG